MPYRGHEPIVLQRFNGLWQQGDVEEVPQNYFSDCLNIDFVAEGNIATRPGVANHQTVTVPLGNIVRLYNYVTATANTLLALTYDGTTGNLYHVVDSTTPPFLILTKAGMADFAFVPFGGRAYITPFKPYTDGTRVIDKGLQSEFLYVYAGDGTAARKAAGAGPAATPAMVVSNGAAGNTDAGFHLFAVIYETISGYLSPPGAFVGFTTSTTFSVTFTTIPVSGSSSVSKRHILATKVIETYSGDVYGYEYFFLPDGIVNDNVATTLSNISFFDQDLLESADYLIDNYSEIPAGCSLSLYHNRLCLSTTYANINLVLVSAAGEPEAISQVDGLIEPPPDGNPITCTQELRDVFYVFKPNRTLSYVDNDDTPVSWPLTVIDQGLGAPVHGLGTVIDSGGSSTDYLIVATGRGISVFTGKYIFPELSWVISGFWLAQTKTDFRRIQIANDTVNQIIYITTTDRRLLVGNYSNGFDPMKIRWTVWQFDFSVNAVALVNVDQLIMGAEGGLGA